MKLGLSLLRTIVGTLFMGHGLQKLTGWFGGHGLEGTAQTFHAMGLRPGKVHAAASGAAETLGGAMLGAGFLTPLGASLISGSMITAIRKVHAKNGVWSSNGGYEYNLVLLGVVFAITDVGPGSWSLDAARGRRQRGTGWALAQLALAAAGSQAAIAYGERQRDEPGASARQSEPAPAAPEQAVSAQAQASNGHGQDAARSSNGHAQDREGSSAAGERRQGTQHVSEPSSAG